MQLRNRDDKVRELRDIVVRFRLGLRSSYGADSALYEQAGGTRISARKSATRQGKPDTAVAPQP